MCLPCVSGTKENLLLKTENYSSKTKFIISLLQIDQGTNPQLSTTNCIMNFYYCLRNQCMAFHVYSENSSLYIIVRKFEFRIKKKEAVCMTGNSNMKYLISLDSQYHSRKLYISLDTKYLHKR